MNGMVWTYRNPEGVEVWRKHHKGPWEFPNGHKTFEESGQPPWLYDMPMVIAAAEAGERIYLTEGEKDAQSLIDRGQFATTNFDGAKGSCRPEHIEWLAGVGEVVILEDNDAPGRIHSQAWAGALFDVGHTVKVVSFPDLPEGGDVSDFLAAGGTIKQLEAMADEAPAWTPDEGSWARVDLALIDVTDPPTPTFLTRQDGISAFYPGKDNVIHGQPEATKSLLVMAGCLPVLLQGGHIVWIDYEDDPATLKKRFMDLGVSESVIAKQVGYYGPIVPVPDAALPLGLARDLNRASVTVIDSALSSAVMEGGYDLTNNTDAGEWLTRYIERLAHATNPEAVRVLIDHDPMSHSSSRKQAIGAQSKFARLRGSQIRAKVAEQPAPGREGRVHLNVTKDRQGQVRRNSTGNGFFGTALFHPSGTGDGLEVIIIEPNRHADLDEAGFDVRLLRDIATVLAAEGDGSLSKTKIRERLRQQGKSGRDADWNSHIDQAVHQGIAEVVKGRTHDTFRLVEGSRS